jgi:hypothetical protein
VCGNGDPHAAVHIERASASGQPLGSWDLTVQSDGRFEIGLEADQPPIISGERWSGMANGVDFDWAIPRLESRMDFEAYELEVWTDPDRTVHFDVPVRTDCWGRHVDSGFAVGLQIDPRVAGADGRVVVPLAHWRELAGDPIVIGIQGATYADEGHQLTIRVYPLRIVAHLGTDRIEVRSASGAEIMVSSSDGATGRAVTDALGWGTARLSLAGAAARLESGDRLTVTVPGQAEAMTLPVLDFDFSPINGLIGQGEPGAAIDVGYTSRDGGQFHAQPVADVNGVWRIPGSPLGYRGGFTLLDVQSIRAEVSMGGRHSAVRSAEIPLPDVVTVWLPISVQR